MEGLIRKYKLSLIYDDIQLSNIELKVIEYIESYFKHLEIKSKIDETLYTKNGRQIIKIYKSDIFNDSLMISENIWNWLKNLCLTNDQICHLIKDVVAYYLNIEIDVDSIWYKSI